MFIPVSDGIFPILLTFITEWKLVTSDEHESDGGDNVYAFKIDEPISTYLFKIIQLKLKLQPGEILNL